MQQLPAVHVLLPTVDSLYDSIVRAVAHWNIPCDVFTESAEDKYAAFAVCHRVHAEWHSVTSQASDIAIACSGTVTIELCVARLPMGKQHLLHVLWFKFAAVVVYPKLSVLTQLLLRYLKPRVTSLALPNILLNHSIIPECTFNSCTADNISATALYVFTAIQLQSTALIALNSHYSLNSLHSPLHSTHSTHSAHSFLVQCWAIHSCNQHSCRLWTQW